MIGWQPQTPNQTKFTLSSPRLRAVLGMFLNVLYDPVSCIHKRGEQNLLRLASPFTLCKRKAGKDAARSIMQS